MSRPSATSPGGSPERMLRLEQRRSNRRQRRHARRGNADRFVADRLADVGCVHAHDHLVVGDDVESRLQVASRVARARRRRRAATRSFSADHATARYSAPLSSRCQRSARASRTASVPLPDPLGPSTAMTATSAHRATRPHRSCAAAPPARVPAALPVRRNDRCAAIRRTGSSDSGQAVVLRQDRSAILGRGSAATSSHPTRRYA